MTTQPNKEKEKEKEKDKQRSAPTANDPVERSGTGTEAKRMGSVETAKRQAERDWQDSAKESGE
ncbi:MAG TPA: hypothetical protein VGM97_16250 [Steroidobacteraceae bacterium]